MRLQLNDTEFSVILEALNESYHLAIKELEDSHNIIHRNVYETKRDISLSLIHKLEKLC